MTKPPTCCDRWRGKPISVVDELDELPHDAAVRIEAGFAQALRDRVAAVPPRERLREAVDLRELEAERLADVAQRARGR